MGHPLTTRPPRVPNDFDLPSQFLFDPLASFASVALIHPDLVQAGKHPFNRRQQEGDAFPILNIGRMHDHFEK